MERYTALVVDDEQSIRMLVKAILERAGFEVDTAANGVEAIDRMATHHYDVVTLDLMMPELDGFGVIDYLADFDPATLRRVIVVSAAHRAVVDSGVFDFVPKPFDVDTLVGVALSCVAGDDPFCEVAADTAIVAEAMVWH